MNREPRGADHDLAYPAGYPPDPKADPDAFGRLDQGGTPPERPTTQSSPLWLSRTTEERLEHGVREWPERFIGHRDASGRLVNVEDADSGVLWCRFQNGWIWVV